MAKVAETNVAQSKTTTEPDARVFPVETRFQKMAKREGGLSRDKAIEQAQMQIEKAKTQFEDWLAVELNNSEA
jgi:hypothetical protein